MATAYAHAPSGHVRFRGDVPTLEQLLRLSEEELAPYDIAAINLRCAEGLPGAEKMDSALCLRTIDQMARRVKERTKEGIKVFKRTPERWDNSRAIFQMQMLVGTLQREFGVRYNPAKIPLDVPLDTDDSFIYGIIQGAGGVCSSLPALYTAVGRRLEYPLKLVPAAAKYGYRLETHTFVRWEKNGGGHFNIEVTGPGFYCPPDDRYRTKPYFVLEKWEKSGSVLKSETRREELAHFMSQRAGSWHSAGNFRRSAEAYAWAIALAPNNWFHNEIFVQTMNEWGSKLDARLPEFPEFQLGNWKPQFPSTVPREWQWHFTGLSVREFLLNDPVNERNWWEPMRQGARLPNKLARIEVTCKDGGGYSIKNRIVPNMA